MASKDTLPATSETMGCVCGSQLATICPASTSFFFPIEMIAPYGNLYLSRSLPFVSLTINSPDRETTTKLPLEFSTVFILLRCIVPAFFTWILSLAVALEAAPPM